MMCRLRVTGEKVAQYRGTINRGCSIYVGLNHVPVRYIVGGQRSSSNEMILRDYEVQ